MTLKRGNVDEWFVNDTRGLEHGFTLSVPLESDKIRMDVEITTELTPSLYSGARSVAFHNADGEQKLLYQGLLAYDSGGRDLPAHFELSEGNDSSWELAIHVDAADAQYPVVIDPVFTSGYQAGVRGEKAHDRFGHSVSMSGDLVAVGTVSPEGFDSGVVDLYRWVEPNGSLSFIKRIVPSHPESDAQFGFSVDLDAGTLVVGAVGDKIEADSGAVYVFERDAGGKDNWGEVARLLSQPGDALGSSVGIDGGILAAGAPARNEPGALLVGATLVSYRRSDGTWSPLQDLEINGLEGGDGCGVSVAVSGHRVACGIVRGQTNATPDDVGSVVVVELEFDESGDLSGSSSKTIVDVNPMPFDFFGAKLAMDGNTLFVGAPYKQTSVGVKAGAVSRFELIGTDWLWQQLLVAPDADSSDFFGGALGFSGNTLIIGSHAKDHSSLNGAGSVYVFERYASQTQPWSFVEEITASTPEEFARFGFDVAVSGDHFVVSSPRADHAAIGVEVGYVFNYSRRPAAWQELHLASFSDFTAAVAIDGDTAAVGLPEASGHGAVELRQRVDDGWGFGGKVESPAAQVDDLFGNAVALAGEWMLVGSHGYDDGGTTNAGRAYLFRRDIITGWSLFKTIDSPTPTADAEFGFAVALTSRWAFIGAPGMSTGYVYDRYEGGAQAWGLATTIDESASAGRFGATIAVDGEFAAFAAPERDGAALVGDGLQPVPHAGRVLIYHANYIAGNIVWSEMKTLPEPDGDGAFGSLNGAFGTSLTLNRGLLVAGEPGFDSDTGRISLFLQNEDGPNSWGLVNTIDPPTPQQGDRFGESVSANTRWIFAGAPGKEISGSAVGNVFVYDRTAMDTTPALPVSRLNPGNAYQNSRFGAAIAASDGKLIVSGDETASTHEIHLYAEQHWSWIQLGDAFGDVVADDYKVGFSVAMDGQWMAVGAPDHDLVGEDEAGAIQLYRRSASAPNGWAFFKNLYATDFLGGSRFGYSLDIYGDTIVAGAPWADGKGAVYVFNRNEGGPDHWGQRKKISPFTVGANSEFGFDVALDDDLLVVGTPRKNQGGAANTGAAYVFERHKLGSNNWGLQVGLFDPNLEAFGNFGISVDVNRKRILVGAWQTDDVASTSGSAYVFHRPDNSSQWELLDTLKADDAMAQDKFGHHVALDGRYAVISATGVDDEGDFSGAVYVFEENFNLSGWTQRKKLTAGAFEKGADLSFLWFGGAVGIRDDRIVVGATGADSGGTTNVGAVYVYKLDQTHEKHWGIVEKLYPQTTAPGEQMGDSVALGDGFIVAGASVPGHLYIFEDSQSAYGTWLRRRFGEAVVNDPAQEAGVWGNHADPDRDGLTNAMEAYMDTDPMTADTGGSYADGFYQDDELIFICRRGKDANGAIGTVKWSRNLTEWYGDGYGSDVEITERVIADEPDHFMIEARATCPPAWERVFLRMEVSIP